MRRLPLSVTAFVAGIVATSLLAGPFVPPASSTPVRAAGVAQVDSRPPGVTTSSARVPGLRVTREAGGLDIPWDVKQLPNGRLLITERSRKRLLTALHGRVRVVRFPSSSVWAESETGLMGLAVDPKFSGNRRIYTCQGAYLGGGRHTVRVVAWHLNRKVSRVRYLRTLVTNLPATSGRHGGCRLLIARDGSMLVGTGDAAWGTTPQNLDSLGGKVLRLSRFTGKPWPSNPWAGASTPRRYVLTYGHRNVQGLAQRSDGSIWSVEHGSTRDDEVNWLVPGGNYGRNPVPLPYDDDAPMTDQSLPGPQLEARWSSGSPTLATSGASWVYGSAWGDLNGTLAVAALKASELLFMSFDSARTFRGATVRLTGYGRLRSVTRTGSGDLLVTTSNGGGRDQVLRVHPLS
jgi:glucose/arabinose dehydrogenase